MRMRPTVTTTVEVGQIRDPSGDIFINLQAMDGLLRMDASLFPDKILAVLKWKANHEGEQGAPDVVMLCRNAALLDEYLAKQRIAGQWVAVWRSDKAVVAPQARVYNN